MTHLIEKQIVELRLSQTKDAFEIQQKVSAFCNNQLMPALDDLFSRLAPHQTHIRLDELVIDLGTISEKNLTSRDFLSSVLTEIERKILAQMQDNPERAVVRNQEKDVFVQWLYFLENGRLPWYAHGVPPDFEAEIPKVLARSEAAIVQLRSLLMQYPAALQRLIFQHKPAFLALIAGVYTGKVQTDLVKIVEALQESEQQALTTVFWQSVCKHVIFLREKWATSDLIVRAFGELLNVLANDLNTLVEDADTEGGDLKTLPDSFPFLKETEAFLTQTQAQNAWIVRKQAIEAAKLKQATAAEITKQARETAKENKEIEAVKEKKEIGAAKENKEIEAAKEKPMNEEIRLFSAKKDADTKGGETPKETEFKASKNENTEGGEKPKEAEFTTLKNEENEESETIDKLKEGFLPNLPKKEGDTEGVDLAAKNENDAQMRAILVTEDGRQEARPSGEIPKEIYVTNAGVVLLHPFLSRLFENLGLTKNNAFKNESMRHKALGILHYLATGEEKVFEYNLVLPKLLCQMPLNMPVEGHWILSKKDRKECDKLLKVAIDYWSALGSTSPAGLREGFLQRKGKLINRSSGWLLQVERSSIDVLIDRLPWGLGIVKLPWMKEFMTVEW